MFALIYRKCGISHIAKKLPIASNFSSYNNATKAQKSITDALNNQVFGQPVYATHPHLINKDELVPGVKLDEFQQRRARLLVGVQKYAADYMKDKCTNRNHLIIVPSSTKKYMSDKIPYFFRQSSDFYYLSGCLEPDSILAMSIDDKGNSKSMMFMRPKDKHAELWEGSRTGVDLAIELFGLDEAYPVDSYEHEIKRHVEFNKPLIWFDQNTCDLSNVSEITKRTCGSAIESPSTIIQGMRLFKSSAEQNLMRRTCEIASHSINEVMSETRPGHSEHHIYAMIDFKCRMRNASYLAYPPVVASGNNATTIHYINNTQLLKSTDLLLMDAGCEYGGYTSDITRTWPVSGKFTEPHRILYDVVLQLQKELIGTLLNEGGQTLDHLFDTMCLRLGKYLQEIGLVSKHITDVVGLTRAGYQFCPHHVSHYLGMDVHDTPLMPRSLRLLPGMVCTVEPGVYISKDRTDVPEEFRGIGIRIEDDILINGDNQVEVLTSDCCKEITDIENLHKRKGIEK
ncbi:xaa-Pro aminopeptidase 3 [Musca vetustissima]|uniref:xaa-Pro aminopeptidase 3 n=1 Tax=Musca vetustissima TaxID=27455 RepID=UPI002AB64D5E|nr:xaa-Pro aminopeptidase 3 [Musca vetustissima]